MGSAVAGVSFCLFVVVVVVVVADDDDVVGRGGGDVDIFTNSSHGDCQIKTSVLSVATVWVEAFNTCVRVSLTVMNVCKGHTCLVTLVTEIPVWSHLTLKYLHGQT